jgi:hypothetical protein
MTVAAATDSSTCAQGRNGVARGALPDSDYEIDEALGLPPG